MLAILCSLKQKTGVELIYTSVSFELNPHFCDQGVITAVQALGWLLSGQNYPSILGLRNVHSNHVHVTPYSCNWQSEGFGDLEVVIGSTHDAKAAECNTARRMR